MKLFISILSALLFISCSSDEDKLNQAKEDFIAATTEEAFVQAVKPLKKLALQGNQEAQVLYLAGNQLTFLEIPNQPPVTANTLVKKGNLMANFLYSNSYWSSNHIMPVKVDLDRILLGMQTKESIYNQIHYAAERDYLPAKIVLAYFYHQQQIPAQDIEKARGFLLSALKLLSTSESPPDLLAKYWAKDILLKESFDTRSFDNFPTDLLLKSYRLQLLTTLIPHWADFIDPQKAENDEALKKELRIKSQILQDLMSLKRESMSHIPFDENAKKTLLTVNQLLDKLYTQYPDVKKRAQESEKLQETIVKKSREQYKATLLAAENGDPEAMGRLFYLFSKQAAYQKQANDYLEKLMQLAEAGKDDSIFGMLNKSFIKDEEKLQSLWRRCAALEQGKCMTALAGSLLQKDDIDSYAEGVAWIYQAITYGDIDAERLLDKKGKMGWEESFFSKGYDLRIPAGVACRAAKRLEKMISIDVNKFAEICKYSRSVEACSAARKRLDNQHLALGGIPEKLVNLYRRGANHGTIDCMYRLGEHEQVLGNDKAACFWFEKVKKANPEIKLPRHC